MTRTVTANGHRFSCLTWGDERAPLVLLVHGFPDTADGWLPVGAALGAEGFFAVAPFLRGYPPTEVPSADTTLRTLATDLVELVPALGARVAHLVGHDWGAEGAYGAVGLAPERFSTLTTIAIPHRAALRLKPRIAWGLRHVISLALPGAVARFSADDFAMMEVLLRRWSPTWRYGADDLAAVKRCLSLPGATNAALGYYRAASVLTPTFMKAPVQVPTLLVAGADDPAVVPEDFEETRRHFVAGCQVLVIAGGHFCHRESPGAFLAGLLEHLRR